MERERGMGERRERGMGEGRERGMDGERGGMRERIEGGRVVAW